MARKPTHIADASAVIAYLGDEDGADRFAEIVSDGQNEVRIHAIQLCEVYYGYLRSDGADRAEEALQSATELLGVVELANVEFMKRVARWKVEQRLGLGDSFAAATAQEYGCPLITTDRGDFQQLDDDGVLPIVWLR